MKTLRLLIVLVIAGCGAPSVQTLTDQHEQVIAMTDRFADITAEDWSKGARLIEGGLRSHLPLEIKEVFDEGKKILAKVEKPSDLSYYDKYYLVGLAAYVSGPSLEALIKQYAPGLMAFREVVAVLAFLGG